MELTGLLPVLRRWLVVVIIATGMATLIGWALAASADPTYEAKAEVLVGPLNTDNDTMRASSALSQTYAELATSDVVLDEAEAATGVDRSEMDDGVRATANGATRFLTVRARAGTAEDAAAVANAVAVSLVELGQDDAIRPEGQLRVIDPATAPGSPISPRPDLVVPFAALAGLLGSVTLVLVFELVGDLAETTDKVAAAAGAPALAVVRESRLRRPGRRRADPLEVLATQLELVAPGARCVVVCGTSENDGTVGLALALRRVLAERRGGAAVIDASTDPVAGLGSGGPEDEVRWAAGTEAQARSIVDRVAPGRQLVVVVAPPPITSTTTLVWARAADATLLGVRRFQARRAHVQEAAANLRAAGAELTFAVLHDGSSSASAGPADEDGRGPAVAVEAEALGAATWASSNGELPSPAVGGRR